MLKITIKGVHSDINSDLEKYVTKKIGKLDKYIPRAARPSAHAEVFLKESQIRHKKECTCEVIVHLPKQEFVTKESTMNIFAAVDIVEAKIKNHLLKYKDKNTTRPRVLSLIRHSKRKNS